MPGEKGQQILHLPNNGVCSYTVIKLLDTRHVCRLVLALGLFALGTRGITDPDFWWHLRNGQLIVQTHSVVRTDPYSFSKFGHGWINHEWLSDVLIFTVYRFGGFSGLILTFAAIIAGTFLLVYYRCPGRPDLAALVTVWGAETSILSWGVRPQMFTLLLAAIFLLILDRADQNPAVLWWTVPLTVLWVNLHAGYALGISLLLLSLVGDVIEANFASPASLRSSASRRTLMLVIAACLAVVPVNPNGFRLYSYPIETLRSKAMQTYISEWFSPDFHAARYLLFLSMILVTLVLLPIMSRRPRTREVVLLSATLLEALRSVRHIPVFVLIAVPILCSLTQGCGIIRLSGQRKKNLTSARAGFNAFVLIALAVFTFVRVSQVTGEQAQLEAQHFPAGVVQFIRNAHPPEPILNHYNWGGYFIWKLYPNYRVFIDGRADLYGDSFMQDLAATFYLRDDWQKALKTWGIRTIVLPSDTPLVAALELEPGWIRLYADSQAVVLTCDPANCGSRLNPTLCPTKRDQPRAKYCTSKMRSWVMMSKAPRRDYGRS